MIVDDTQIEFYEGLVRKTSSMVQGKCEMEFEDVEQELRIKVFQALRSYDPARSRMSRRAYVFGCVKNRTKDLMKYGGRRRAAGVPYLIEDLTPEPADRERFERRYLSTDDAFREVEDEPLELPDSLVGLEREVVLMLHLDYSHGEIAKELGITRPGVEKILLSVRVKLSHLAPAA